MDMTIAARRCKTCRDFDTQTNIQPCASCVDFEAWTPLAEAKDAPKHDQGRLPWHLFPFDALDDVIRVYDFGKQKNYPEHSWRKGFHYSRIFSATCRHLFAWWRGEENDVESGLPHLSHCAWNVITLLDMTKRKTGTDDRLNLEREDEAD